MLDANADNLRALLEWLGYAVDRVPADRLRKFSVTAQVTGRPDNIQFAGLDLRVDTSRVTGGIAYVDRGRPGFGARLEIDRLNLDAYAPDLTGVSDTGEPHVRPEGVAKPDLAGWLAGFDANLNADIGTLTVAGRAGPAGQAGRYADQRHAGRPAVPHRRSGRYRGQRPGQHRQASAA